MLNFDEYNTPTLINGKIVPVITFEDRKRYMRDLRKLKGQDKICSGNITAQNKRRYKRQKLYQESWGGSIKNSDNNSLLKIDVNLFHN